MHENAGIERAPTSGGEQPANLGALPPRRTAGPSGGRTRKGLPFGLPIPPAMLAADLFDEPEHVLTSPAEGKNPIEGRQRGHVKHGTRRGRHFSWLRLLSIAHKLADPQAEIAIDHISDITRRAARDDR